MKTRKLSKKYKKKIKKCTKRCIKKYIRKKGKKYNTIKKNKRNQYGCKKMKGGGPSFQPMSDLFRGSEASRTDVYNTLMGNDVTRNEVIQSNVRF